VPASKNNAPAQRYATPGLLEGFYYHLSAMNIEIRFIFVLELYLITPKSLLVPSPNLSGYLFSLLRNERGRTRDNYE